MLDHFANSKLLRSSIAAISLWAGFLIYVKYRTQNLNFWLWAEALNLKESLTILRNFELTFDLPNFVIYSLPNGLWCFSYIVFFGVIFSRIPKKSLLLYSIIVGCLLCLPELLQVGYLRGTFDPIDLYVAITCILIAVYFNYITINEEMINV